ncbi:MAG: type II secretion system F family protein [Clostridia bacterium]|nr:type II secretion system F family protein [Clostridia bacterium]
MPSYKYKAMSQDGSVSIGRILAMDKNSAIDSLKKDNLQPITIQKISEKKRAYKKVNYKRLDREKKKQKQRTPKRRLKDMSFTEILTMDVNLSKKVTSKDILVFANDFYILKKAGFNNIDALQTVCDGIENTYFKEILEDILLKVKNGEKLYASMELYSDIFPEMFINFVKVGEETGTLDTALSYAREYVEKSDNLRKTIISTVVPRVLQFLFIMIAMFVALIIGVPLLQKVYDMFESSQQIPKATLIALDCANFLMKYWYIILLCFALICVAWLCYIRTPKGRYFKDRLVLKLPIIGRLNTNILVSRFFQAMLLNLKNGMRIQESLEIARNVSKNYYFASVVEVSKTSIANGESWYKPFEEKGIFNKMMTQMIDVGMKSDLSEMMDKVNEYINIEIEESLKKFTKALPEITYLFVGIALVVFTIVVLVPLINMYMGGFIEMPS